MNNIISLILMTDKVFDECALAMTAEERVECASRLPPFLFYKVHYLADITSDAGVKSRLNDIAKRLFHLEYD